MRMWTLFFFFFIESVFESEIAGYVVVEVVVVGDFSHKRETKKKIWFIFSR